MRKHLEGDPLSGRSGSAAEEVGRVWFGRQRTSLSRPLRRSRLPVGALRMVAAVAAVAAVVFAVLALRPVPEGTLVAVAKTDLAPGAQITRHQLRVVAVPPGAVPQGASDQVGRFVGVAPTRAVDAGTVVTDQVLGVGAGADPLPSGYAQAVVPLAEDSVLVEPGNTLEVWGPSPECATQDCPILRLADNVQVAQVSTTESSALSGPGNALVTVNLPANSVGPVLHAVQSGSVHFVRSG